MSTFEVCLCDRLEAAFCLDKSELFYILPLFLSPPSPVAECVLNLVSTRQPSQLLIVFGTVVIRTHPEQGATCA